MTRCDNDNIFHVTDILFDTHEVLAEVCVRCKERFYWQKDRYGRIDNAGNIRVNARKFIQPDDEHFEKEYGKWSMVNHAKLEESQRYNQAIDEEEWEDAYNQEHEIHKIL